MPEVREREAHDSAFGFCGAREWHEVLQRSLRIVFWFVVRRWMLRRRLRLPLSVPHEVGGTMRKSWKIFGAVQAIGVAGAITGLYLLQDGIVWILYSLFLLPGILISFPFSPFGHAATHWPLWVVYSVAVIANTILFAAVSEIFVRLRKSS